MNFPQNTSETGLSIIELLVVLTIIFIVSTFAFMQIDTSKKNLKVQNISTEFKTYLERARFDSLKRGTSDPNEMAKVVIQDSKSFTSETDFNQDGNLESGEVRKIDFSYQEQVKFHDQSLVFPIIISFNKRGHTTAIDGNGSQVSPTFLICQDNCENIDSRSDSFQIVTISPTGTVTILNGDELTNTAETPKNISTQTTGDVDPIASSLKSDGSIPVFDLAN